MRALLLALLLAACSEPPSPSATASLPPAQGETIPSHAPPAAPWLWRDVAGDPLPAGAWRLETLDAGFVTAAYAGAGAAPIFALSCDRAARRIALTRDNRLEPDQDTTMTIIVPAGRLDFPAHSRNAGLPQIRADVSAADPRLAAFATAPEGFAVEAGGDVVRLPPDPALAAALAACA